MPVRVTDQSNRYIPDLRREDFKLFEDGVEQEVGFFETTGQPLTIALMLDISDSATSEREEMQATARAFLDHLQPADRVMLVAFDKYVHVLTEPTGNRETLYRAINGVKSVGGTSLYDATLEILTGRFARERGRKAIILLTDGIDTTSRANAQATLRAAQESDALVYVVQYDTVTHPFARLRGSDGDANSRALGVVSGAAMTARGELLADAYKHAVAYLRLLSGKTNGRYYMAESAVEMSKSFEQIAAELREQYVLGFYPKNRAQDGRLRKLKVQVARAGSSVRARRNYVYKPRKVSQRRDQADSVAALRRG